MMPLLSLPALAVVQAPDQIELLAPGEPLPDDTTRSDVLVQQPWLAISLAEGMLRVQRVTGTRRSDWEELNGDNTLDIHQRSGYTSTRATLDLPADALLAVRSLQGVAPGTYPSAVASGLVLHQDLKLDFKLGTQRWQAHTEHQRHTNGKLLPGSLKLMLDEPTGSTELLPAAPGSVFLRQELLWLGDLDGDHFPDALVKRTYITGEADYLLIAHHGLAVTVAIDPDQPYGSFSSGIDNMMSLRRHRAQTVPLPREADFSTAGFSISSQTWFAGAKDGAPLPEGLLKDATLKHGDLSLRFTVERVAAYQGEGIPGGERYDSFMRQGGTVLVRVHNGQQSQVLLLASELDESPFTVSLGEVDGKPAIRITYYPHYNNFLTYVWVLAPEGGRPFRRLWHDQAQGC